jgi:hypothetical protein
MTGVFLNILRDERTHGRRDPVCPICEEIIGLGEMLWYHIITMECYHQTCFMPDKDKIITEE